jgi:hypothetical protein
MTPRRLAHLAGRLASVVILAISFAGCIVESEPNDSYAQATTLAYVGTAVDGAGTLTQFDPDNWWITGYLNVPVGSTHYVSFQIPENTMRVVKIAKCGTNACSDAASDFLQCPAGGGNCTYVKALSFTVENFKNYYLHVEGLGPPYDKGYVFRVHP